MKRKHAERPEYQETLPEALLRMIDPADVTLDELAGAVNSALHLRALTHKDVFALIDARGDKISEGPESNFTIFCAKDEFIFGYCELVKSFDHEMTEEEKASTIQWETRQLEIMDWFTDDVDWITGEKHDRMRNLFLQKGFEA